MTTSTSLQTSPYLPRQRNFPNNNPQALGAVLDKMYIEVAQKVNERTIGIFAKNFPVATGESWFIQGQPRKQQTLRQVYTFGAIAPGGFVTIPVGDITFTEFTRMYGNVITIIPDYRPLPYVDPGLVTIGMALLVEYNGITGDLQIRVQLGAMAPAVTSGNVVLEWLSPVDTNS